MSFCGVNFLIWFFAFEVFKEILDAWDRDDNTKWYKNDRKSSWSCDRRYHLHDSNNEKVNIGYFWKLNNEIEWYKIQNSVLWCFDGVIANIIVGNICYYRPIRHLAEWWSTRKNKPLLLIGVSIDHILYYNFNNFSQNLQLFAFRLSKSWFRSNYLYINENII